jgi:hypothetical protein
VCLLLLLTSVASAAEPARPTPIVTPISGEPYAAKLVGVDANWELKFDPTDGKGESKPRTLSAADLVSWGVPAESGKGSLVFLTDGGRLVGTVAKSDKDRLHVESSLLGSLGLPLELIRGILFRPPAERGQRDRLAGRIESSAGDPKRDTDLLILENGDELAGNLLSFDGAQIELEATVGAVKVEISKVAALVMNPSLVTAPRAAGLRAIVGLSDGSRFTARTMTLDELATTITPLGGVGPWTPSPDSVVFMQPLGGKAIYLSDLPVESYKHIPYLSLAWPYRLDANVTGTQLRAGGRCYVKGIGMHSAARLTYRLDKPYRRFEAGLAIDDATSGRGSVAFRVFVDSQEKYASPIIRGGMPPAPISIDITGGQHLSLIIDFAERADELDHADWLNARLVE